MDPLVSVIIVNYNGKNFLEKCLDSLKLINYDNFEILVVDNNSSDGSIDLINKKFSNVILVELEKNYGFAEANNMSSKKAKGEYLLFLNNDTIVTPDFIKELITTIQSDKKIAICQSLLLKPSGDVDSSGDFVDTFGRAYSSREITHKIKPILSARGASMLIEKNIFFELDGFDSKFFATFEDVDLGWRAWLYGYKVVLSPKSLVYHYGSATINDVRPLIQFHGVKNTLILRLTNFETFYSIKSILSLFTISFFKRFFKMSLTVEPEEGPPFPPFKIIFNGHVWILKNLGYVLRKKQTINSKRKLSTRSLIDLGLITKSDFRFKTK